MRDDPTIIALVTRARLGDKQAWEEIVERYTPLLWSICRRHRLNELDAAEVVQRVWLRLVEHLPSLREPAALSGWLVTTTRRECFQSVRAARRQADAEYSVGVDGLRAAAADASAVDEELLNVERHAALREAFAQLQPRCQLLLRMLVRDPPAPYAEISETLDIPIGSIGPTRARCLERLRRCPALATLIAAETRQVEGGERHAKPMVERGRPSPGHAR